jgi:hypothetical protein
MQQGKFNAINRIYTQVNVLSNWPQIRPYGSIKIPQSKKENELGGKKWRETKPKELKSIPSL